MPCVLIVGVIAAMWCNEIYRGGPSQAQPTNGLLQVQLNSALAERYRKAAWSGHETHGLSRGG